MTPDNFERYSRNILIDKIGPKGQKKLLNSRVLICGAGGLGSAVITGLSSLGIGHLGIVDNDNVELSNLNRQYIHSLASLGVKKVDSARLWIENYNKDIEVKTFKTRLTAENYADIIKGYKIIVDCFDTCESKFLLNDISIKEGVSLVHGGVSGFDGQVTTIIPKVSPCLRCLFPVPEENAPIKGVVSPAVSIIGSIQAMEVLKLILKTGEPLSGRMLVYKGLEGIFKTINFKKSPACPLCSQT